MSSHGKAAWASVPDGTIIDEDIIKLVDAGELITEGFDRTSVKQACYELRASEIFYETSVEREDKRLTALEGYVLRPHSYVTVIVKERVALPPNVMARILTKGQLFSLGIMPVSTYADPGFAGRLGITLSNASHRHILIKPGQPIAKIEFSILSRAVARPYTGQHGYETAIWPIPFQLYADNESLRKAGISPGDSDEIARSYGPVVAELDARLRYYEHKVWLQIGITVAAFAAILSLTGPLGTARSLMVGVAANLITTFVFSFKVKGWSRSLSTLRRPKATEI